VVLVAIGLVLAAVLLGRWGLDRVLGFDGSADREAPSAAPTATGSGGDGSDRGGQAEQQGNGGAGGSGRPDRSLTTPASVSFRLPPPEGECDPASVLVTPDPDSTQQLGKPVELRLALRTTADTPCRPVLGAGELLVRVVDEGGAPVWDSERCPDALPDDAVTLRPGWSTSASVQWSGRRSDRGCTGRTLLVPAGSYEVQAAVLGGEPADAGLVLADPPRDKKKSNDDRDQEPARADKPPDEG